MRRPMFYRLEDHDAVPCTAQQWAGVGEHTLPTRRVGHWKYVVLNPRPHAAVTVSTVFLGLDHAHEGAPALFETMIFMEGHDLDGFPVRYPTWERAAYGHSRAVRIVRAALGLPDEDRKED